MGERSRHEIAAVALAVAAALAMPVTQAAPPRPDTSAWKCERCVFYTGASASVETGVLYASGANAPSGRYSGIDHNGAYAEVDAKGRWRTRSGAYGSFVVNKLGLPSRRVRLTAGQEGRYELSLSYQGQPLRQFDDTVTPYRTAANNTLLLPSGWASASTTGGMTALGAGVEPVHIESDRRVVSLSGKYFASSVWTVFGTFSHSEQAGTGIAGASFLTEALQLPEPIDTQTNDFQAGALWTGRWASLRVAYDGSWFDDRIDQLLFQNPYSPIVPGATSGLLSLPPSNNLQQFSLSGELSLPLWSGTLTYLAAVGRLAQDGSFVPGSALASAPVTLNGSLGGDIRLTHYALALALRPLNRLDLRGRATYNGRDDHTSVLAIPYVVTDTLPGGTYFTPRYGEDRTRLTGTAEYRLLSWVRAGVGGLYAHTHYAPGQVLTSLTNESVWGEARLTPLTRLSVTVKGGGAARSASAFHASALPVAENALLRAYDYAPRDREFLKVRASWAINAKLAWSLEGSGATDAYRLSALGLTDSRQREISTTLTWTPGKPWSAYLDGSYQHLEASQRGQQVAGASPWREQEGQYFWTLGVGGQWAISSRWHLKADYVHAHSRSDTRVLPPGGIEWFPEDYTALDTLKLDGTYRYSAALTVRLRYEHAHFASNDWALQGVYPNTIPTLLALGAQPNRYTLDQVGLSFVYQLAK